MSKKTLTAAGIVITSAIGLGILASRVKAQSEPKLFIHIKHAPQYGFDTIDSIQDIYSSIVEVNKTGLGIGIEPQFTGVDWNTQLEYLRKCKDIPVMLNVYTSDDEYKIYPNQIEQAIESCPVKYLRFHEVVSYYGYNLDVNYIHDLLNRSLLVWKIPVFWNEWDVSTYPSIANIILTYEDTVLVSFGTNSGYYEPLQGYQYLQRFKRKAASVQSWYWWERNGRQSGYEYLMPPELMRQHTTLAFQSNCEIVQYEPYSYFFHSNIPTKETLNEVLGGRFI